MSTTRLLLQRSSSESSLYGQIVKTADYEEVAALLEVGSGSIVFTNGCFDIIHPGHVEVLAYAREMACARLDECHVVVGLNSDESVRRLKGTDRPIFNEKERAIVVASMRYVDHVVIFHEDTPLKLINALKPVMIVKGHDYSGVPVVGQDISDVVIAPSTFSTSTTSAIEKIRGRR